MGGALETAHAHTLLRPTVAPGRTREPNSCYPPRPRAGSSAIREVRGPVEETHKSSYITGSNGFACVQGAGNLLVQALSFDVSVGALLDLSYLRSLPHSCHYFMPR
jgi:hypothetical protein